MLSSMSSHLLTEWMAYHGIEPFGDELLDVHFAQLTAAVVNANRKRSSSAVEPKKFRLWKHDEPIQDPATWLEGLKDIASIYKEK